MYTSEEIQAKKNAIREKDEELGELSAEIDTLRKETTERVLFFFASISLLTAERSVA